METYLSYREWARSNNPSVFTDFEIRVFRDKITNADEYPELHESGCHKIYVYLTDKFDCAPKRYYPKLRNITRGITIQKRVWTSRAGSSWNWRNDNLCTWTPLLITWNDDWVQVQRSDTGQVSASGTDLYRTITAQAALAFGALSQLVHGIEFPSLVFQSFRICWCQTLGISNPNHAPTYTLWGEIMTGAHYVCYGYI